ncbi:efflux RND transporter periplasmic adaptor subunit [Accumulibacter sp.]|uniref:efflux RND transporter periplasmic adaptor subunit n=1 Tax=Accumulibacter sp. TaxID=2053492 RepID=UPI0025CBC8CF|nr:efflux RND transporter periplasmic adaptor subunit [Accumulibacter sp.]MCM8612780.1 efflux RND transporter periplasmic adaptor subunit [Accumulibacter sp.]MCM8637570.1 efflux RND transporter periplasmic adaptor subunit [Accumulibacter sp.]MCM8639713.1 efflux RND transporter periplasmic adaptor subunit [Accumulibacter sp.]
MNLPPLPLPHRPLGVAAIFVGLLLVATTGCSEKKSATPVTPVVEVVQVVQRDVPIYMEWVGTMDGNINAVIRPQVTGYLIKQNYREGDLVKKGQPLFEIDPRTFEAAVDEAKGVRAQKVARFETASANLARVRPLAEKNAVSQKDLDDATGSFQSAKAELEAADANLKTAKLNLGFTRITSPITGIAGIARAQIGDLLSPGGAELTTVSSVDPIKVYFNISEQEYLKVATAASAAGKSPEDVPLELILVDGSTYPHQGKVSVLNRQVDVTTGTFKVASLFANANNLLRPGQFGRIRATMKVVKGALLVPQRAVTEMQGKFLLAVVGADNKVDIRPVVVGDRIGSDWLIAEGLKPGETVVAEGTQKVRPGMTVETRPFVAAAPPATGAPGKAAAGPAAAAAKE